MALEVATYISDLVSTNPVAGDPLAQADDHLRLIKTTIKATFPNVNGEVSATDEQLNAPTNGTATASTSGTSVDFTGIPSWVKRITVSLSGVSTNGTSPLIVQLGDAGGVEASGYLGAVAVLQDAVAISAANHTTGIALAPLSVSAATIYHGTVTLTLVNSATNTWNASVVGGISNAAAVFTGSFTKATSATLDRVRLTTTGGADTFDAGTVNIQYE